MKQQKQRVVEVQIPYNPHRTQYIFHSDNHRFRILAAGTRWGKTTAAVNEAIKYALEHKKSIVWWIAPTYSLSEKGFRLTFRYLPRQLIKKVHRTPMNRYIELVNGSEIWFKSAENPISLLGESLSFIVFDEANYISDEAFQFALRGLLEQKGSFVAITTPYGVKNWVYEWWLRGKQGDPEIKSFQFKTVDNPIIDPNEVEKMRRNMPENLFRALYEAEWDFGGKVFDNIDEIIFDNITLEPKPNREYVIGVDLARIKDYTVCIAVDASSGEVHGFKRLQSLNWAAQLEAIIEFGQLYNNGTLVVDATSLGEIFIDELKQRYEGIVEGVKISNDIIKEQLILKLIESIKNRKIKIPNIKELIEELKGYTYSITPTGNIKYHAAPFLHDDCVIALALANTRLFGQHKTVPISVRIVSF